ncbi:hypothetical protein VOLCADRAFT_100722, partial [Volvox carteri f. nagariensis]
MQIRDLYLQKRQISQRLKRELFNFTCELAQCRAGETFIVIVDGVEWVATVPRRTKPDDIVSMTFSAVVEGTEVHRSLVGMLGSGAKEESLKRYIREGLALQTSEYKEQVRDMSHDAALSFILEQVRRTTPAEGQIGCVDNMTYHWPMRPWTRLYEVIKNAAALPPAAVELGLPGSQHTARSAALSEHAASSFPLHLRAASVITSQAASAADRTMTTSEEPVHRGFGVCNETRKRKRAPNMTWLEVDDEEEQQREADGGHTYTEDAAPWYPCTAGHKEGGDSATAQLPLPAPEDARGGEAAALPSPSAAGPAAMPGPRHTAGHQEGGDSATAQLPLPAPEDARGGEAAALPSPSAAGPAAMPGPRHTAGHQVHRVTHHGSSTMGWRASAGDGTQEGGDSATAQLPLPAPEDARGGEAAALPSPSAAGPAAMPGPRHTAGHQVHRVTHHGSSTMGWRASAGDGTQEGGDSATAQLPLPAPEDARGGEAAALPSPSAAGPAAMPGPRHTAGHQ